MQCSGIHRPRFSNTFFTSFPLFSQLLRAKEILCIAWAQILQLDKAKEILCIAVAFMSPDIAHSSHSSSCYSRITHRDQSYSQENALLHQACITDWRELAQTTPAAIASTNQTIVKTKRRAMQYWLSRAPCTVDSLYSGLPVKVT